MSVMNVSCSMLPSLPDLPSLPSLGLGSAPASGGKPSAPIGDTPVHEAVFDNGLRVLVLPIDKAPVVTHQVWYRVGSRNEQLGTTGLSHLLEHMMFKGTEKLAPDEFARVIQKNGGQSNAFTSKDYTTYFETLRSDRLPLALELEADRMVNLKLAKEQFEPERNVVMEERRLRYVDNPWGALYETLQSAAFSAHPYMWPIIGWMSDLEAIHLEDLEEHYRRFYHPGNAIVVVAGNVDPDETIAEVREHFGSIPAGPEPRLVVTREPPQRGERRVIVRKEANLPAIVWAFKVPNGTHEDGYALDVLATILAGGESSPFYRSLVVERKIFLSISTDYPFLSIDPDLFTITGQLLPGRTLEEAEAALREELERVRKEPPPARELEKARNQIEAEFVFAQDSNFYQAMLLGRFQLLGDWRGLYEYLPGVEKVTAEDVRRVAETYLVADHSTMAILEPIGRPGEAPAIPVGPEGGAIH